MRPVALLVASSFALTSCNNGGNADGNTTSPSPGPMAVDTIARLHFPIITDNLQHDTLAVQVTFDLGDSSFMMVAGNMDETFEGLRLYRYRFKPDSTVEIMADSPPAYDSWTMLPTFFSADRSTDGMWVLANFGERESWGQKLLWLDWEFSDMGFMDVALPERVLEDDTLRLKRRDISPSIRFHARGDTNLFTFACDSVFLYDDQQGHRDSIVAASAVRYTFHRNEGLQLWLGGRKFQVKKPA